MGGTGFVRVWTFGIWKLFTYRGRRSRQPDVKEGDVRGKDEKENREESDGTASSVEGVSHSWRRFRARSQRFGVRRSGDSDSDVTVGFRRSSAHLIVSSRFSLMRTFAPLALRLCSHDPPALPPPIFTSKRSRSEMTLTLTWQEHLVESKTYKDPVAQLLKHHYPPNQLPFRQ